MMLVHFFATVLAAGSSPTECARLAVETSSTALALDYQNFDQTPGQGFRILAAAGCPRQAADLIERYIEHTGASERSLRWHLAQMRGESGEVEAARVAARATLHAAEAADAGFRWNAHVRAYLGFLEGDRAAFDAALSELDQHAEKHPGNAMNARFWTGLAPHFVLGYAAAVQASNQP